MKPKVVITVRGGVAEIHSIQPTFNSVDVEIIDYDELEAQAEAFNLPIPHRHQS
jgi:hypothetical protein